jgi:tRNA threonylcarbamoyladenosine biosynthesis protein TsaE
MVTTSPAQTRALGERLGAAARAGDVILLEGPLGAGKTVLVQGLARGLQAPAEVASPTFVLIRQYRGRLELVHADLYRLDGAAEVDDLGLLELSADGVLAVEWADRSPALGLPGATRIRIQMGNDPTVRRLTLEGGSEPLRNAFSVGPS